MVLAAVQIEDSKLWDLLRQIVLTIKNNGGIYCYLNDGIPDTFSSILIVRKMNKDGNFMIRGEERTSLLIVRKKDKDGNLTVHRKDQTPSGPNSWICPWHGSTQSKNEFLISDKSELTVSSDAIGLNISRPEAEILSDNGVLVQKNRFGPDESNFIVSVDYLIKQLFN